MNERSTQQARDGQELGLLAAKSEACSCQSTLPAALHAASPPESRHYCGDRGAGVTTLGSLSLLLSKRGRNPSRRSRRQAVHTQGQPPATPPTPPDRAIWLPQLVICLSPPLPSPSSLPSCSCGLRAPAVQSRDQSQLPAGQKHAPGVRAAPGKQIAGLQRQNQLSDTSAPHPGRPPSAIPCSTAAAAARSESRRRAIAHAESLSVEHRNRPGGRARRLGSERGQARMHLDR